MKFITDDPNYPSGRIEVNNTQLDILVARGWTVNLHTPSYANHIGTTVMGVQVGFGGWLDNLSVGVFLPEAINNLMVIQSQADVDALIGFIDAAVKIKHIKLK